MGRTLRARTESILSIFRIRQGVISPHFTAEEAAQTPRTLELFLVFPL